MIRLTEIWPVDDPHHYKVHFASWNGHVQPLDVLARDVDEWRRWQEYRPKTDQFNRRFIFSLARVYYEEDTWLFGGIFRVTKRLVERYGVELTEQCGPFVRRLKLRSAYRGRARRVNMEGRLDEFEVLEILREPYSGRPFPGFESIDLSFGELEILHRDNRPDWRAALEGVSGVYLVSVRTQNAIRRYVGAAYGEQGVWSRWGEYLKTGHGGNMALRELMGGDELGYCRRHVRFALLEHMSRNTLDGLVQNREEHWKKILETRGPGGLNRN